MSVVAYGDIGVSGSFQRFKRAPIQTKSDTIQLNSENETSINQMKRLKVEDPIYIDKMKSHKRKELDHLCEIAREKFFSLSDTFDNEDHEGVPIEICQCSLEIFLNYESFPKGVTYENGRVFFYELPKKVHERTHVFLETQFNRLPNLNREASIVRKIGDKWKEPDNSFVPKGRHTSFKDSCNDTEYPTVVIEIAHRNESFNILKKEIKMWMSAATTVMVAIGIKIFQIRVSGKRRITLILGLRGQELEYYELGTVDEKGKDVEIKEDLKIPFKLIYDSATIPICLSDQDYLVIDLKKLSSDILELF